MEKVILISNLHCANCALELQEELSEITGVSEVTVDFINQRIKLNFADEGALKRAIHLITRFEDVKIIDANAPRKRGGRLKEIISISLSLAFFLPAVLLQFLGENAWISFAFYLASFFAAGWAVVYSVAKNIARACKGGFHLGILLDENLLMLIASVGAFCIGEYLEGAIVMVLYQIGELLQSLAVGSSRNAIERLASLKSERAVLLAEGEQREVLPEELRVGDTVLLRRGDKIPADCTLLEGETQLDTKSLTGEAYLREVKAGDELLAGCVNEGDAVRAKVLRAASESAAAKILDLVENATAQKAKPEKFITKFARVYTPVVVGLALLLAFLPPVFYGYTYEAFTRWLNTALNFLVISCPCALIISVPLAYFIGVGALARVGALAKGAVYLDRLAGVKVALFDKTGTLTEGKFYVERVSGGEKTLDYATAVEKGSSHPLAQAFRNRNTPYCAQEISERAGRGLSALIEGKRVLVGSERFLKGEGVIFTPIDSPRAVIYVAEEGKFVGAIEIGDGVKTDAYEALLQLKRLGVRKTVMLTGDTATRAQTVADTLPLDEARYELLPEQKSGCVKQYSNEGTVAFIGDGINDTPAMAASDLAISMGSLGSDAAIEASDLVLVSDQLSALPKAMKIAQKTRKIVWENILFSIGAKAVLLVLSLCGLLPLWVAILGDVGLMLLAVFNALRIAKRKKA